jgi:hypothetical protein
MATRSRLGRLAGLVIAGLVVCAPVAQATEIQAASPVMTQAAVVHEVPSQAPPGPVLDPAETDKANGEATRNKIIAGGVAVVLALLVFWGRKTRSKKKKT